MIELTMNKKEHIETMDGITYKVTTFKFFNEYTYTREEVKEYKISYKYGDLPETFLYSWMTKDELRETVMELQDGGAFVKVLKGVN